MSKKCQQKRIFITLALLATLLYLGNILGNTTIQINQFEREKGKIQSQKVKILNNKPLKNKITSVSYAGYYNIITNSNFSDFGFPGDGSKGNPYIIEGIWYLGSYDNDCFCLMNTTAHFIIRNCFLNRGYPYGISLYNVTNGIIFNNTFTDCYNGIGLFSTNKTIIKNNRFFDNNNDGITLNSSRKISIYNNTIIDTRYSVYSDFSSYLNITNNQLFFNNYGICLNGSDSVQITNNHISNCNNLAICIIQSINNTISTNDIYSNEEGGLLFSSSSNKNNVVENNINNNYGSGIEIQNSSFNNISTNRIAFNLHEGILVAESSHNNTFFNNSIVNSVNCGINVTTFSEYNSFFNNSFVMNMDYGINLDSTTKFNIISWNDFLDNSKNEQGSQASDNGLDNKFYYNHWSDWTEPDSNNDGFVDEPYAIVGSILNEDPFPLVKPNSIFPSSQSYKLDSSNSSNPLLPFLLPLLLSLGIVGISTGFVYKTRKKDDSSQLVSNNTQLKYAFNSEYSTASISNLDAKISSLYNEEVRREREFPDKSPWFFAIIAAIVGFILQIVRPPQIRNLSYNQVMEHPIRKKLLAILREKQIQNFSGLKKLVNCGTSVLLWHLQVLEDFNLIQCETINKIRAYYLVNSGISPSKVILFCTIQNQKGLLISSSFLIPSIKGWSINELCNQTKLNKKSVRYYCKKLENIGVIKYLKDNRKFKLVTNQQQNLSWLLQLYNYKQ